MHTREEARNAIKFAEAMVKDNLSRPEYPGPVQDPSEDPAKDPYELFKRWSNYAPDPAQPGPFPPREITNPSHYCRGGIESRRVITAWGLSYNMGTALAYICRADHKGSPIRDIQKAIQHLQFELEDRADEDAGLSFSLRKGGGLLNTLGPKSEREATPPKDPGYPPGA